ncbi:major facilitator superfamily transporter [Colletotrichum simmondsii]|uniref:Major facilitator superfamily transporter n=1 Tax=Colletotrichum simmondsii TaxID=703756 RepID=A0A135SDM1_9PEZI|nr:major facilitator superfamily transporter [Colletotrichum simmondsii]
MGSPDVEKPDGLTSAVKIPQLSPDPLTGPIPAAAAPLRPVAAADDEVMEMSTWKKWVTLAVVCWMALPVTFSGSSILTATSEVAADFNVSTHAITTANAGVFIAMAMSALIWLPTSNILGRRTTYLVANCLLTLCSIGSALSNSFACFTAIWVIGGTTGPFFLVAGQTILADIFEPTTRGTAVGCFLGSCVAANAIAPLTGAVIVTFTSWRVIYGVQAGMTFLGLIMAFFFVPKASQLAHLKIAVAERAPIRSLGDLAHAFNPMGVLRQFKYPNIVAANFACGLLGFNQYGLLSSIRRVINPRFGLTTPLISGLFYLAPGAGFLMGSTIGGRVSDHTVKRYIRKRNGLRLPQDRLKSSLPAIFFVLPAGTLIYGWSVQKEVGGIALPIISCFFEGLGLMWSFSGLNTYSAEAMPERRTAVISSKYIVQYSFGAGSVGGLVPMIDAIGVGWSFTIKFSVSLKRHQDDSHIRFKNLQTRSPPTAMEVLQLTEEINRDGAHRHRSWRPNATRLVTVLERIRQFAPIGDVLVGGAQNLLASGVWATVRMTLEISLSFLSYFDKVSTLLMRIGKSSSLHKDFALLFPTCRQTQTYMCEYVIVFIKICKKITIDAHKSFASHLATSFTSTFDSVFKPLEDDLRSWGQMIENRVAVLVAKANIESNSSSVERFSRFQIMISRDAAHRDRETRAHRLFEALAPNQKEFESIWTRERKKGTSSWILNDKSYQEWLGTKTSATLWLQGNLGSGKTVTIASVVADLLIAHKNPDENQHEMKHQVFHAKFCIDLLLSITPPTWQCVLVLDGLDEAPLEEVESVLGQLHRLMQFRRVKLCCSSRPTSGCKSVAASSIGITQTISFESVDRSEDLQSYISAEVENWKLIRPLSSRLEQLVKEQLLVRSQGMFLWLSLQIEAICPKYTRELRSDSEILDIINNLPRNLPQAFDQAILRIPDMKYGSRIFQLIASADPCLSLDELRVALNVRPGSSMWSSSTLHPSGFTLASTYGGSLLEIDEEDSCIRFIHHSVLLHLVQAPALPAASPYHFHLHQAEFELGAICVTYLNYGVFENSMSHAQNVSFDKIPGTVANSILSPNALTRRLISLMSLDRRARASNVDLERLNYDLHQYRSEIQDDIHLFLPYASKHWLRLTKCFSEAIDPLIYSLWENLVSGSVSSASSSLPWSPGSVADATKWSLYNRHGPLFRHLLGSSDAVVVKEVLRITLTVIKQYKVDLEISTAEAYPIISRLNELHHHYLRHEFFLSGEDAGLLVPTYLLHMGMDVPVLNLLVEMDCLPFGAGDKYCQFKDPVAVETALGTIARHGIPKVLLFPPQESQEEAERDRCIKSVLLLTHYLPSIDTTLSNGSTILHTAINHEFEDLAETLLKDRGADPDGARLQGIPSPLQLCLQKKFRHLAVTLTQMGADIIATPDNGLPPFFLAMGLRDLRLFDAMWYGNPHRSSRQYGPKKETAFQFACRVYCDPISKDYPDISDALINIFAKDPDVNRPNGDGETPLMITAMTGNLDLMARLLDEGADPTSSGVNGTTPLHLAVGKTVSKLLEFGVDPNKVTPDGISPLMVASLLGDIAAVKTLIHGGALRFQAVAGAGPLSEGGKALFRMSKRYPRYYDTESSPRNATIDKIEAGDTALSLAITRLEFMTGDKEQISRLRQIVKDTANKDDQNKVRAKVTHITERWDDFEKIVLELLSRKHGAVLWPEREAITRRYRHTHCWQTILVATR